jgi:hypothetical protein
VHVEKVSELLLPNGAGWDVEKLSNSFLETNVEDIKKIPVGRAGTIDFLASNYTETKLSRQEKTPRPRLPPVMRIRGGWLYGLPRFQAK